MSQGENTPLPDSVDCDFELLQADEKIIDEILYCSIPLIATHEQHRLDSEVAVAGRFKDNTGPGNMRGGTGQ